MSPKQQKKPISCEECPLFKYKPHNFIQPKGKLSGPFMIISDRPHGDKIRFGLPDDVYTTVPVKCHQNERVAPPAKAMELCKQLYLNKELYDFSVGHGSLSSLKIVTMGPASAWALMGRKAAIRPLLGRPYRVWPYQVLSTYHPSDFLLTGSKMILTNIKRAIRWACQ